MFVVLSILQCIDTVFFFFLLQWLNSQKLVESLVSLIDPEIDEEVSSVAFSFVLIRKWLIQ